MKKLLLSSAILAVLIISACKKSNNSSTASPSLMGKWGVVSVSDTMVINGSVLYSDNYMGTPSDYLEFRSDGKAHAFINGNDNTVDYQLQGSDKVIIDGQLYSIQVLTTTNCRLYYNDYTDANNYSHETINLTR